METKMQPTFWDWYVQWSRELEERLSPNQDTQETE